ncbi:NnrU family protein [Roseateles sp.]|uniref:NnrU family protein n=1 Tax=Roseateles sp. TaxID=1971397 RepID=UPI002600CA11|nr:NnrU family protein [Roseateles sp.]MBV8036067.1 NnrU family protein [Roseateles sp.]
MTWLALGLALFLGIHLTRALAPQWREAQLARLGDKGWKGVYTLVSLIGFGLILWGFSRARLEPVVLWAPIRGMNHATAALMLVAMVLLAAAYMPRNHLKAKLQHPLTLAVKTWAFAHLIANNTLADLMLFGSFLVWSILVFRAARRRPAPALAAPTVAGTAATVVVGIALWAVFAFWAHAAWLGVAPLGR